MSQRALAATLIKNFGILLNLPDLSLDDVTHSCVLLFDGDIVLNIEFDEGENRLILSSYLGELPDDDAEAALRELMVANLYWHRTEGATLGLEEATGGIVLAQAHPVGQLDDARFEKCVETFVNQSERWKQRLAGGRGAVPADDAADAMSPVIGQADGPRIFG